MQQGKHVCYTQEGIKGEKEKDKSGGNFKLQRTQKYICCVAALRPLCPDAHSNAPTVI